jgi:superfamily II RNA helicase
MTERLRDVDATRKKIQEKQDEIVLINPDVEEQLIQKFDIEENMYKSVNAERKIFERALSQWNNNHMSPKWKQLYSQFKKNLDIKRQIDGLNEHLWQLLDFEVDINKRKRVLQIHGYLENDDTLTQKGILASEIHEGHPLLMAHAYYSCMIHDLSQDDIITYLSIFLEDVRTDEKMPEYVLYVAMRDYAKIISDTEELKSDFSYWDLTNYWVDPVRMWIAGEEFPCEEYGIEHGNFVRAMLKLANIVDEWTNMATIMQDVEMIEKMKGARNKIVRGIVVPDSLYLRI